MTVAVQRAGQKANRIEGVFLAVEREVQWIRHDAVLTAHVSVGEQRRPQVYRHVRLDTSRWRVELVALRLSNDISGLLDLRQVEQRRRPERARQAFVGRREQRSVRRQRCPPQPRSAGNLQKERIEPVRVERLGNRRHCAVECTDTDRCGVASGLCHPTAGLSIHLEDVGPLVAPFAVDPPQTGPDLPVKCSRTSRIVVTRRRNSSRIPVRTSTSINSRWEGTYAAGWAQRH